MSKKTAVRKTSLRAGIFNRMGDFLTMDRMIIGGSILSALVIIGIMAVNSYVNRPIDIEGVERIPVLLRSHSESPVDYDETPPVGGIHYPVWQNCGVYEQPIGNELGVHSLEHGAVWMTYDPDLPADQLGILTNLTQQSSHRLLSPYPGLPSPIVASAWGFQLRLETADDPRLAQFIRQYEQGSTTPELGAVCSRGESRTLAQLQSQGGG
jgi:hypothetical protein